MDIQLSNRDYIIKIEDARKVDISKYTYGELNHLNKYSCNAKALESSMGIYVAKKMVSKYYFLENSNIEMLWFRSGKPYIRINGDKSFNLPLSISHSNNFVAVLLPKHYTRKKKQSVGIDIEKIVESTPNSIIERFTNTEKKLLTKSPSRKRALYFTAIWTRKEAIAKAANKSIYDAFKFDTLNSAIPFSTIYIKEFDFVATWVYLRN